MNDLRERYDFLFDGSGDLTQETLLLYVFGPLENEARQAVEQHLEDCEMCRDAAEGIALLGTKEQAVSTLAMADAKLMERLEVLKQKVTRDGREALMNQKAENEPVKLKVEKPQRRIGWYRYAAAASVLLVVGVAFWLFNQTMQNQADGIAMGKEDSLDLFKNAEQPTEEEILNMEEADLLKSTDSMFEVNEGGITSADSGGTEPYTYAWTSGSKDKEGNGASSGLAGGTYAVTVTDANCCEEKKKQEDVIVAQKPTANAPGEEAPMPSADEENVYWSDLTTVEEVSADKEENRNRDDKFKTFVADSVSVVNANNGLYSSGSAASAPVTVSKGTSNDNFRVSNATNMTLTDASVAQAQYPGGMAEVQKYFDKVVYPPGIQRGYKGVITFEIKFDKKGKITKSTIVQGVGEPFDKILHDHLNKMPNWEAPQPYGEPFESTRLVTVEVTVR
jgi:hypothetical protein